MILLAMSASLLAQIETAPSFGDGSLDRPYQISTLDHLFWITENDDKWNSTYIQTANIDAFSTSGWDSNSGFSPIGNNSTKFTGSYDGDGYTINGLTIDRESTNYIGLFGYANGATIQDLGVTNVNIKGKHFVGALVGKNEGSTISNCYSTGSVEGTAKFVGGLMGWVLDTSTVSNCYSTSTVKGAHWYVGGLAGQVIDNSTVSNCYSTGSVEGTNNHVGGLAGEVINNSTISNCYSTGSVSGTSNYVGGLAGEVEDTSTVSNCYSTGTVTGNNYVGGVAG